MQSYQCRLILSYSHGEDIQRIHGTPHYFKVVLEDGDGPRQGFVSAATEQGHARVQQDGGNEGRVRDPTQAFDAAFKTSCWKTVAKKKIFIFTMSSRKDSQCFIF